MSNEIFGYQEEDNEFVYDDQFIADPVVDDDSIVGINSFTPIVQNRFAPAFYTYTNNTDYLLDETTGAIYQIAESISNDNGNLVLMQIRTISEDGGTNENKFCSSLELIGDKVPDTAYVSYSDDDYQSFKWYRPVNLDADRTALRRCGHFRRRAHNIIYFGTFPLRLSSLELNLDKEAK